MNDRATTAAPRRVVAAVALATVALGGILSPPPADAQSAAHAVFQVAEADWLVREKKGVWLYLAVAAHVHDAVEGRQTLALVTRSRCAVARTAEMEVIACSVGGRLRKIPEDAFVFDPALETAELRIRGARLDWSGEGLVYPDGAGGGDPYYGAFAYASLERYGTAVGRALGRRMPRRPAHNHFAWLLEGAFAEVLTTGSGAEISIDDRGRVRAQVELTVSRRPGARGR